MSLSLCGPSYVLLLQHDVASGLELRRAQILIACRDLISACWNALLQLNKLRPAGDDDGEAADDSSGAH